MKFRLDLYGCGMVRSAYITHSSDLGMNHEVFIPAVIYNA
jgi:hypothetical protein